MKKTFLSYEKPILTGMILCSAPLEAIEKIRASRADGAEAYGIQLCHLRREFRNEETLREIFSECGEKPIYITSYRGSQSEGMSDEECVELLLLGLKSGAVLCDIVGDLYCKNDIQLTTDPEAVKRQKELISEIRGKGGEVLISSHLPHPLPGNELLRIAFAQAERGADVLKIVTKSDSLKQLPELISAIQRIISETGKKLLFLDSGPCGSIIRRLGIQLGVCTSLCLHSYGEFDTELQPLITEIKAIWDNWRS